MNYTVYIVYILKNPKIKASKIKQNKANKLKEQIRQYNKLKKQLCAVIKMWDYPSLSHGFSLPLLLSSPSFLWLIFELLVPLLCFAPIDAFASCNCHVMLFTIVIQNIINAK